MLRDKLQELLELSDPSDPKLAHKVQCIEVHKKVKALIEELDARKGGDKVQKQDKTVSKSSS